MVLCLPNPPSVPLPRAVCEGDDDELEDWADEDDGGSIFDEGSVAVVVDGLAGDGVRCRSINEELETSGEGESVEDELD